MSAKIQKRGDLLKTIKAKVLDATCKWDVLVSYNETRLDEVLRKKWDPAGKPKVVPPFDVKVSKNLNVRYRIKLHPPLLQFETDKTATLQLAFDGTKQEIYKGDPDVEEDITPGNYTLKISAKLSSIEGKTGAEPVSSDHVIVFDQGVDSKQYIIIPFKGKNTKFDVIAKDEKAKDADEIMENTPKGLATHFRNTYDEVDLCLALVQNDKDTTSEILRPKSFRFGSQPGVLCIFMKTEGSNRPEGYSNPVFDLDDISPIPDNSTASIIINRDLFQKGFLVPELQKGCKGLYPDGCHVKSTGDAEVDLNLNFHLSMPGGSKLLSGGWTLDVETFNLDCKDKNPVLLQITNSEPFESPEYKWSWDWEGKIPYIMISPQGVVSHLNADATGKISSSSRTLTKIVGDEIDFHLTLTSNDQPSVSAHAFEGALTPTANIGSFDIQLQPLNFFTTKNILVPGAKLVKVTAAMAPAELVLMADIIDE